MDKSAQNKMQPAVKKVKKKQGKDELDRLKQAEKKKRRLEKALAASAAICTELELKKLKKKEEQQRLDEEGAAIAEAVALRVLVGEESDDLCDLTLTADDRDGPWIQDRRFDFPMAMRRANFTNQYSHRNSFDRMWCTPSTQQSVFDLADISKGDWAFYPENYDIYGRLIENGGWGTTALSPGVIAAQAVSSLQIRDSGHIDGALY